MLATRYEHQAGDMALTRSTIRRVETVPGGELPDLLARLGQASEAAERSCRSAGYRAGWSLLVDVTRSPQVAHELMARIGECQAALVVAGHRDTHAGPWRTLGRLTLLSNMSVLLARGLLAAGPLEPGGDERLMGREKVREVLAAAQARPPRLEEEELALGGSVDDDAALAVALAAWQAWETVPDRYVAPRSFADGPIMPEGR